MRQAAIAALALLCAVPASAQSLPTQSLYIQAGRLIDVESGETLTGRCILTEKDKVARVEPCGKTPAGATRVDWSAYTVLPGLFDLHTHLADAGQSADLALPIKTSPAATALLGAQNARLTLLAGFTTVRDVGTYRGLTDVALRDAIAAGTVPGPRMFVAGGYLTTPGGGGELNGVVPNELLPPDMRLGVSSTPEETRLKATHLFEDHVDFLKLIATGAVLAVGTDVNKPELSEEQMRAAVEVARAHGSYATAHGHGAEGIKAAIRAGAHSIEHASLIDDEGLRMAKEKGVWLVMDVFNGDYIEEIGTKEGWPEEYLRKNRETTQAQRDNFAKAVKLGVKIGYGTDSGVYPHGLNARQFAYMVRYGMTPLQAIRSATIDAATLVGHEKELGSITPGKFADMIAVSGDPLKDVRVLESIAGVIKGGERYK